MDNEATDRARTFERAMRGVYARAKREAGYNATYFLRMLADNGGLETARTLVRNPGTSEGFATLWKKGRLDLTVEELDTARHRLTDFGVTI